MSRTRAHRAKIVRPVIEVLDFFDGQHQQATVMDIVRRYDRPQSSTSELLLSMVEAGVLHEDSKSRLYSPAPGVAMLGYAAQSAPFRDGRFVALLDRLSTQTGLTTAVFGMVGLTAQIYSWQNA